MTGTSVSDKIVSLFVQVLRESLPMVRTRVINHEAWGLNPRATTLRSKIRRLSIPILPFPDSTNGGLNWHTSYIFTETFNVVFSSSLSLGCK